VSSLNVTTKILKKTDLSHLSIANFFNRIAASNPTPDKLEGLNHEQRLSAMFSLTICALFPQRLSIGAHQTVWQSVYYFMDTLVLQKAGLTPNVIEQLKYLTSCLKKLGQSLDLNEAPTV
jgi:hypothetical protein